MTWIQTYNGKAFDLINPSPDDIDPTTIAVGLSRLCRFGGHCKYFYSVAQHSVHVCERVEAMGIKGGFLLPALLHDAHEIYWGFGDIPRPVMQTLAPSIRDMLNGRRRRVDKAVAERFGFDPCLFESDEVKQADNVLLAAEKRDLMLPAPQPWEPLPPPLDDGIDAWDMFKSYQRFYDLLNELTDK